jgi:dihydroneopterin aldolase
VDTVFVRELRFKTVIGCWDWERQIEQEVSIDLDMGWDTRQAAATEDLKFALDYKAVSKRVVAFVRERQFELVETAANAVAELIMNEFSVPWLRVSFSKPRAVTGSAAVGVVIERGKRD